MSARAGERPLHDVAIEALGGTPASVERPAVSPLRPVLPPWFSRRVGTFDRAVDGAFGALRGTHWPDRVMYGSSALGDFSLLWHLVGLGRALADPRHERAALRLSGALVAEQLVVNIGVKSLFRRSRPEWEQYRPRGLRRPRSSSFPSSHASSAFLAASLLADGRPGRAPAWYALAAVVASSRIHVKIHHASDVVAGAAIGLALAAVVKRIDPLPPPATSIQEEPAPDRR